jgi:hypothetical protein
MAFHLLTAPQVEKQMRDEADLGKEHDKILNMHTKQGTAFLDKLERTQLSALSTAEKTIRGRQQKEARAQQADFSARLKLLRAELSKVSVCHAYTARLFFSAVYKHTKIYTLQLPSF